jgi:hypothetical protein
MRTRLVKTEPIQPIEQFLSLPEQLADFLPPWIEVRPISHPAS